MRRDSAATRARILEAAVAAFAEHGLAGARIDRIAEAADANKRSIYVYFGSKEELFATALHRVISDFTATVPLTEDDLPGYAARTFDYLIEHPETLRLSLWRLLERPAEGPAAGEVYAEKIAAMGGASGGASGLPPADLIVLVYGLATAWMISPEDLLAADGSDPRSRERLATHRAALVEGARRLSARQPREDPTDQDLAHHGRVEGLRTGVGAGRAGARRQGGRDGAQARDT